MRRLHISKKALQYLFFNLNVKTKIRTYMPLFCDSFYINENIQKKLNHYFIKVGVIYVN